jgi:RNA polymerase sigma-B factor
VDTRVATNDELLRRFHATGAQRDLDELVVRLRPLGRRLALRYAGGSLALEDLEQIACIGLVKAIRRFDPGRGHEFGAFAIPTIIGELKRSFRQGTWALHLPRRVQERVLAVRDASSAWYREHGRAPTPAELAGVLGCTEEDVVDALCARQANAMVSIDAPRAGEEESLGDLLGEDDAGLEQAELRCLLEAGFATLTRAQLCALHLRFEYDLSQTAIAERMGVSQMQVSRLLRSALERLSIVLGREEPQASISPCRIA